MNGNKKEKLIGRDELRKIPVSINGLSLLFGLSDIRVTQLIKELEFARVGKGISLVDAVQKFIALQKSKAKSNTEKGPDAEKERQTVLQNEMLELKIAEKNAELVPMDLVGEEWDRVVSAVKQKLLALPTKAAPNLINETTEMAIKTYLDSMIREALGELTALGSQIEKNVQRKSKKAHAADDGAIPASAAS